MDKDSKKLAEKLQHLFLMVFMRVSKLRVMAGSLLYACWGEVEMLHRIKTNQP